MSLDFFNQKPDPAEYAAYASRFKSIQGWLSDMEGYALLLAAAKGPGAGEIVEIGSWMGKSTCWLAAGSKSANREKVHAVDPFDGGPMLGGVAAALEGGTTYHQFVDNLIAADLFDYVEPIVANSTQAVKKWTKPIRLLFIDGDHAYEAIRADFESWSPFLVSGALIAFDDVTGEYEGAKRYYEELLSGNPQYHEVLGVGKMNFIQRD